MSPEDTKDKAPEQEQAQGAAAGEDVKKHNLGPLSDVAPSGEGNNMDLLMDVTVPVVAQLGSTEIRIKEILKLLPGSIIELEKLAGEPVDLLVRGRPFAQGEVVVVEENFGVRVTKILTPTDRATAAAVA